MLQINHLVIVGGPSAVGKTTLLRKIRQGDYPCLREQLDIANPSSWLYTAANQLTYKDDVPNLGNQPFINLPSSCLYIKKRKLLEVRQPSIDRIIIHYNFMKRHPPKNGPQFLPDLISRSCRVSTLTLCTSSSVLFQRITSRLIKLSASFLFRPNLRRARRLRKLWMERELYRNTSNLFALYEKWSEFIEEHGVVKHLLLESAGSDVTMAIPYDRDEVKKLLKGELTEGPIANAQRLA